MKDGGYAKGGAKVKAKREPEAVVRKEVALLRKAGAPKALVSHEVREMSGEMDTPATKRAEVSMMKKAKAPWDKPRPKDLPKPKKLSSAAKAGAKAAAEAAGRPYPNRVDKMRAAAKRK